MHYREYQSSPPRSGLVEYTVDDIISGDTSPLKCRSGRGWGRIGLF
jgi:hypothetical protein